MREDLEKQKTQIRRSFPNGDAYAEIAAHATKTQSFTALDLYHKYEQPVNVLVLDVDETLRSCVREHRLLPRYLGAGDSSNNSARRSFSMYTRSE